MVGTQKTTSHGRSPDHVIVRYKNTTDFEKKIKTMGMYTGKVSKR